MNKEKSRHQSLFEFLECLQLEYITCELRKKVYYNKKDKAYYGKTMNRKKEKIDDIAGRNHLSTIFTSEEKKKEMYDKVYKDHGYPNFIYNSIEDELEFKEKDKENYYSESSEVRVLMESGDVHVGVVKEFFSEENIIYVKLRNENESKPFPVDRVTRIL